jgi:hypothetical protein
MHWEEIAMSDTTGAVAATIEVSSDKKTISFNGLVRFDSARAFAQTLEAQSATEKVQLQSGGGNLLAAQWMAKLIRKRALSTEAVTLCWSACTLVLLAGKERLEVKNTSIGFHADRAPGAAEDVADPDVQERSSEAYTRADLSGDFIAKVNAIKDSAIWVPSTQTSLREGVLTRSEQNVPNEVWMREIKRRADGSVTRQGTNSAQDHARSLMPSASQPSAARAAASTAPPSAK